MGCLQTKQLTGPYNISEKREKMTTTLSMPDLYHLSLSDGIEELTIMIARTSS
jgi:hypothetical protein